MKLRTRLALAFFLLSVLPLTAVTIYSFNSSQQAVRRLAAAEAGALAGELTHRMAMVADDVQRRMARFWQAAAPGGGGSPSEVPTDPAELRVRVANALGATAGLVEQMEFIPSGPSEPLGPDARARASATPNAPPSAASPSAAAAGSPRPPSARPPAPPYPPPAPPPPGPQPYRTQGRGDRPPQPDRQVELPTRIVVDLSALKELQAQIPEAAGAAAAGVARTGAAKLSPEVQQQLQIQLRTTERVIREAQRLADGASGAPAGPVPPGGQQPPPPGATPDSHREFRRGGHMGFPIRRDGFVVGTVSAQFNLERTLGAVMTLTHGDQGEIPFAVDAQQIVHTPNPNDVPQLKALGLGTHIVEGTTSISTLTGDWVIVSRRDPSGVTFGIARPISDALRGVRRAAVQNLGLGLAVVALAFFGIIPLSHRMTRNLSALTAGVHEIAHGNLRTRVPVRSHDEFGMLGQAVNQMAEDLESHQQMLVKQERLNREMELCREIQTEMLPRQPLRLGLAEVKGVSIPAREVGGDFFNYFLLPDGDLALLVGDVSGKGVSAALLMANVQATLRARVPLDLDLPHLVDAVDREIEQTTPRGVYLTLFVCIFSPVTKTLRYVNAGHNPQFVLRASGALERMSSTGLPVGLFAGHGYQQRTLALSDGDILFFYTDGMVEVENETGDMFGSDRLEALLMASRGAGSDTLLAQVEEAVRSFRGKAELYDDATMMLFRLGPTPVPAVTA